MDKTLKLLLYFSFLVSFFLFESLIVLFNEELTFRNMVLSISPALLSFFLYRIYLKDFRTIKENTEEYKEGQVINVFAGMPWSKSKGKYSEGVFFWYEGGRLLTELGFHKKKGGDPDVFNKWLKQEKASLIE